MKFLIVFSSFMLSLVTTFTFSLITSPPLGRLVSINGRSMHLLEMGQQNATTSTVILDAFLGGNLLEWSLVQPEVAHFAYVCSYDRAGLGWSEPSSADRTSAYIVQELKELLSQAGIKPPYILVGHSSGGISMRLFANTYPDDVYGLILVDSSHEEQKEKIQALRNLFPPPALIASSVEQDLSWLPLAFHDAYKQLQDNPITNITTKRERDGFDMSGQQVAQSKNQLVHKPLIVITRGTKMIDHALLERLAYEKAFHALWLSLQQDLLSKSTQGKQVFVCGSGHMIQRERPEIIVEAVRSMVAQYEQEKMLHLPD